MNWRQWGMAGLQGLVLLLVLGWAIAEFSPDAERLKGGKATASGATAQASLGGPSADGFANQAQPGPSPNSASREQPREDPLKAGQSSAAAPGAAAPGEAAPGEAAASAPNPWSGASFPVENFSAYTSAFGWRQHPYGGRRFHYGLDFAAPMGSYIVSWWEGKVIRVAQDNACGTHAIIQSGAWTHVYCHMQGGVVIEKDGDRFLVDRAGGIQLQQGSTVQAGTRIGRIGMTGSTTGPHLHWGLKYDGSWVDPALVIQEMYAHQQ